MDRASRNVSDVSKCYEAGAHFQTRLSSTSNCLITSMLDECGVDHALRAEGEPLALQLKEGVRRRDVYDDIRVV